MKRNFLIALMFVATAGFAAAQGTYVAGTDVLGAHLNYGRGCAACHAPHSGAYGNGAAKIGDPNAGATALWGQDVESLYNTTITTAGGGVTTLGYMSDTTPQATGILPCLSCHDGNYAQGAMMKNTIYETVPKGVGGTYGSFNSIPTLLGNDGSTKGNYLNDHPVGPTAIIQCNSATYTYGWDCSVSASGKVQMTGAASAQFVKDYGFFVKPAVLNGTTPVVVCTTCHNQHLMNVVSVTNGATSGLTTGLYTTMFFIRAPYNPATTNSASNAQAQFCRQCHGGESNEMNNGGVAVATAF